MDIQKERQELIDHIASLRKTLSDFPNLLDEYKDQLEREIEFKSGILTHYEVTLMLQKEEHE